MCESWPRDLRTTGAVDRFLKKKKMLMKKTQICQISIHTADGVVSDYVILSW